MSAPALVSASEYGAHVGGEVQVNDGLQSADGDGRHIAQKRGPATLAAVFPINRIGAQELVAPLVVRVEWDASEVVMCHGKLRIWGSGDSAYAALEDFGKTFLAVVRSYEETPESEMTDRALAYRQELRAYLP